MKSPNRFQFCAPSSRALRYTAAIFLAAVTAASCGDSGDEQAPGPRREVLQSITDVVIIPTYRALATRLDALAVATEALRQAPTSTNLSAAQEAWRVARHPWKQSEAFRFGPSESLQLRAATKIDWSPVVPQRIEEQIAGSNEINAAYIDTLGTNRRGFLAIEYLLFDVDAGDADVMARLQGDDGGRRLAYAAAVAADIALQAHRLAEAWAAEGGNYRFQLIAAGEESEAFDSLKDAVDTLVGAVVLLSNTIEENKIGRPFGTKSNGEPRPESVEAARSANSVADILDNLESIENVYLAEYESNGGLGLSSLVVRSSPEIDAEIRDALARTKQAVRGISSPLSEAIFDARPTVQAALDAAGELRLALAVDLVSALGATPKFVGDGD